MTAATMRAVVLRRPGGPEALRVEEVPVPELAEDEVLVRVRACGVCGHDLLARAGRIPIRTPTVLGHEIAGVVAAAGPRVPDLGRGDRVALVQRIPCGRCEDCIAGHTNVCRHGRGFYGDDLPGGYAEYVVATARNAVRLPDGVPDAVGAILSCAIGTGLRAVRAAEVAHGDVVVVTGAGGGVGLHAVQLGRHAGATVVAQTTSLAKKRALLDAGATAVVVDPSTLRDTLRALGARRGADAVIEVAGPPTFNGSLAALRPRGRVVLVGNTDPRHVLIPPGLVIVKELRVVGSAHATISDLTEVVELIHTGAIVPTPVEGWGLADVVAVHAALERRAIVGRAVVTP